MLLKRARGGAKSAPEGLLQSLVHHILPGPERPGRLDSEPGGVEGSSSFFSSSSTGAGLETLRNGPQTVRLTPVRPRFQLSKASWVPA